MLSPHCFVLVVAEAASNPSDVNTARAIEGVAIVDTLEKEMPSAVDGGRSQHPYKAKMLAVAMRHLYDGSDKSQATGALCPH